MEFEFQELEDHIPVIFFFKSSSGFGFKAIPAGAVRSACRGKGCATMLLPFWQ